MERVNLGPVNVPSVEVDASDMSEDEIKTIREAGEELDEIFEWIATGSGLKLTELDD